MLPSCASRARWSGRSARASSLRTGAARAEAAQVTGKGHRSRPAGTPRPPSRSHVLRLPRGPGASLGQRACLPRSFFPLNSWRLRARAIQLLSHLHPPGSFHFSGLLFARQLRLAPSPPRRSLPRLASPSRSGTASAGGGAETASPALPAGSACLRDSDCSSSSRGSRVAEGARRDSPCLNAKNRFANGAALASESSKNPGTGNPQLRPVKYLTVSKAL